MSIESDSFEVENGLQISSELGNVLGPFITGGPNSPIGLDLSTNALYLQNDGTGIKIYEKFGLGVSDWKQVAPTKSVIDKIYPNDLTVDVDTVTFLHEPSFTTGNLIVEGCVVVS